MFNLSFGKSKDCESTNRREFLRMGSLGLAGLTLPKLLQAEAASKAASKKVEDRSVIFMWMQGGPSHIDSFDPKPNAPTDIRGGIRRHPDGASRCADLRTPAEARRQP